MGRLSRIMVRSFLLIINVVLLTFSCSEPFEKWINLTIADKNYALIFPNSLIADGGYPKARELSGKGKFLE